MWRCWLTIARSRLGLETESKQALFVLRHVVMSPFQGAGNFVEDICKIFQKTLEEEIAVSHSLPVPPSAV